MEETNEMLNEMSVPAEQPTTIENNASEHAPETLAEQSAEVSSTVENGEPTTENVEPAQDTTEPVLESTEPAPEPAPEPAQEPDQETSEPAQEPAPEPSQEPVKEPANNQDQEPVIEEEPLADYSALNRDELVAALNELLQEQDITSIKNRVASIREHFNELDRETKKAAFDKFIEEGGNKDEYEGGDDAIAEAFRKVYNVYRERRQKHIDEIEAAKQKNLEAKKQILEELRQVINDENSTMKQSYDAFNTIQERWKTIGEVPRADVNELWQNYHFLIEQFFAKVKMNKELMLLDQRKNLEKKTLLCEKAEELIVEPSITKAAKELQNLRDQWREIGPVPMEQNDEIWTRFRTAASQVDERRREYYAQLHEEQEKNLLAKQALLEKVKEVTAEMPTSSKQWSDKSAELDEMLKVWKSIGPVPREQNEEIWKGFKGIIDNFYTEKKNHFDSLKDEQNENYNKKIDLCLQAEAISKRDDWKKATEELLKLQDEWKQIGPVNRKHSEKIWQRFRGACDEFFSRKSEHFSTIRGSEKENLEKKEAILAELKAYNFGEDKDENLTALKDFQRRWMEVGFVPIAEKQRIQKDFRDTINGMFEKLKISAREAEMSSFRESLKNNKGGLHSKRDHLLEQIQKLRSDVSLWENNLGFLANSKQADLLKEEFDKKLQKARQEIALLEAKLRIVDDTANNDKADDTAIKETEKTEE